MARLRWIGASRGHVRPHLISVDGCAVALAPDNSVPCEVSDAQAHRLVACGDYELDTRSGVERAVSRVAPALEDSVRAVFDAARLDGALRATMGAFLAGFLSPPPPPPPADAPVGPPVEPEPEPEPEEDEDEDEDEPEEDEIDLRMVPARLVDLEQAPPASPPEVATGEELLAQAYATMEFTKKAIVAELAGMNVPHDGRWTKERLVAALYGLPDDWKSGE